MSSIIHRETLVTPTAKIGLNVFAEEHRVILTFGVAGMEFVLHLSAVEADQLQAMLADRPKPIDLSNIHPVMADAIRPFLGGAA